MPWDKGKISWVRELEIEQEDLSAKVPRSAFRSQRAIEAELLGKQSLRQILPFVTWEGVFAAVFITITGSPFLTGFALFLGANNFEIGLIGAIPFISQVSQIIAAYRIDLTGRCKAITTRSLILGRQIWWLLVPLPFIRGEWRLEYMLGIFIISSVGATMGAAGWFTWVADLVPGRLRGRYFGSRSAAIAFSTIVTFLIAGVALDFFQKNGRVDYGYAVLLSAGSIAGLVAAIVMNRLPEKKIPIGSVVIDRGYFLEPFRNAEFGKLLIFFFVWNVGTGIAGAFFAAHMLTNLQMTFTQISFYATASLIAALFSNKPWGALIDKYGSKPILAGCSLGLSVVPLIWLIPRQGYLWILGFEAIYAGILWAGFNLAAFNLPLSVSPEKNRTIYLAVFAVISGTGFFVASLIGGGLAESWKDVGIAIGPQVVVNYHILFVISATIRGLAALMAVRIKEQRAKDLPGIVKFLTARVAKGYR
jgi:MFS family permease